MKFSEFVYKRTDVDEVRNRIREITEELKHASSLEEQIPLYDQHKKRILCKRTGVQ